MNNTKAQRPVKGRRHTDELRSDRQRRYSVVATFAVLLEFYLGAFMFTDKYYNITGTRGMTTLLLTATALAALIYVFFMHKLGKRRTPFDLTETIRSSTVADWGIALYLLAATISALLSDYPDIVIMGDAGRFDGLLMQYAYATLYFLASRLYRHRAWFDLVISGVVFSFTVLSIFHFFGINLFGLYGDGRNLYNLMFMSLYGNVNIVSTVAGLMTVYFALLFVRSDEKYYAVFGAVSCCAFLTQSIAASDSGWVSIAAGLVLTLPFVFTNRQRILRSGILIFVYGILGFVHDLAYEKLIVGNFEFALTGTYSSLNSLWLAVAALGAIIFLAAYFLGRRIKLKARTAMIVCVSLMALIIFSGFMGIEILGAKFESGNIHQAREMLHGNLENDFMSGRGYIWKSSFALIQYNPIFGSGPDTLGKMHIAVHGDEAVTLTGVTVDKAHNEYIQYAVCEGLVGLAGYLTCVIGVLVLWIKRKNWLDDRPAYVFAAGGAVAAYLCQAMFNLSVPISAPYFFILLGFAANRQTFEDTKTV